MAQVEAFTSDAPSIEGVSPSDAPLAIGLASLFGSIWWYTLMFVYVANPGQSTSLTLASGVATEPIAWFWSNLIDANYGWTAASYFSSFILYGLTSVVEVIGWAMYLRKDEKGKCFFRWWTETTGFWYMLYGGILPWFFAVLQIFALSSNLAADYGSNSIFLAVGNGFMWIIQTIVHIVYTPLLKE